MLHNIHLQATTVTDSQDSLERSLLGSPRQSHHSSAPSRTHLPIRCQSASVDYLTPGQIVFLSATFKVSLPSRATATNSSIHLNARRVLDLVRSRKDDANTPSCALLLSLSEILSVQVLWSEYGSIPATTNTPGDASPASARQVAGNERRPWHEHEIASPLRDSILWVEAQEDRVRDASTYCNKSNGTPSTNKSHSSSSPSESKLVEPHCSCSVSCGILVLPPPDAALLDSTVLSHFQVYAARAMLPQRVIQAFMSPLVDTSRGCVSSDAVNDGMWAYVNHLVDCVRQLTSGQEREGVTLCYSFLSHRPIKLNIHPSSGADGTAYESSWSLNNLHKEEVLMAAKNLIETTETVQYRDIKVITTLKKIAVRDLKYMKTCNDTRSSGAAKSNRENIQYLFPELCLSTCAQSIVFLWPVPSGKEDHSNGTAGLNGDFVCDRDDGDSTDEHEGCGMPPGALEGRVYNASIENARHIEESLHFKSRIDSIRHHIQSRHEGLINIGVSPRYFFGVASSPISVHEVIGLAHAVALSARSLLDELELLATAWWDMKSHDKNIQQYQYSFGAWRQLSNAALVSDPTERHRDNSTDVIPVRRVQVGQRLHVRNIRILQRILYRQLIADRIMTALCGYECLVDKESQHTHRVG